STAFILFFLVCLLPRSPTLFPYTTLFRSDALSPKILSIIERGEFLLGMDDPIFDKSKYEIESMLIERFQKCMIESLEDKDWSSRSEEHTSELQSRENLVCRLLLEKKKRDQ